VRSRHETTIVAGAQRFLEPGEMVIRALVAVPRGYTRRMAGSAQLGAVQMERALDGAGHPGVQLATPMGLVLTTRRLLTLQLSTAYGLGVGGSVQELLSSSRRSRLPIRPPA
jgi:hypothetical protein